MTATPTHRTLRLIGRWSLSALLLTALLLWVDTGELASALLRAHPGWVCLGIALGALQVLVSALRWRYTAACVGIRLPVRPAVQEYFLSTLTNQLLPGGVIGDANRAWRHRQAQSGADSGRAVHAVILERLSGQLVLFPWVILVLALAVPLQRSSTFSPLGLLALASGVATAVVFAVWLAARAVRELGRSVRQAFWPLPVLGIQLGSSLLVVSSYALLFAVCGLALDATPGVAWMLAFAPIILLSMLIPITASGWGLREGAAAALWSAYGWPPAEGVAVSVLYGLLVLASSLPGFVTIMRPSSD